MNKIAGGAGKTRGLADIILIPALLSAFALLLAWYNIGGPDFQLDSPVKYGGDTLGILTLIKRNSQHLAYFENFNQGYPFGAFFYDYPTSDLGLLLIFTILSLVADPFQSLNLFFLISFPVTALSAYFVLRSFGLARRYSLLGTLAFTFLPFHFMRFDHIYYTWYFSIPIFFWYAWQVFSSPQPPLFSIRQAPGRTLLHVLALAFLATCGVYYAFFGCITLLTAGLLGSLRHRSWRQLLAATIASLVITLSVGASLSPYFYEIHRTGQNEEVAQRRSPESEIYGLKLSQMLLPHPLHPIDTFSRVTRVYSNSYPLVNENATASLGILGAIGFLASLVALAIAVTGIRLEPRLAMLSAFNFVFFTTATVGGFSSLFALLVIPLIRGWNRISVFIAFASITIFILLAQTLVERLGIDRKLRTASIWLCLALAAFALWEQTVRLRPDLVISEFNSDRTFVANLEKSLPSGSAIYQLPYMPYPEVPNRFELSTYGLSKPYLHSKTLKWSYGSMKGREGDRFFRALAQQPMQQQLDVIGRLGFAGIHIDRGGFADKGAALEEGLRKLLNAGPALISPDGRQAFYRLEPSAPQIPPGTDAAKIMQQANFLVDKQGLRYSASFAEGIDFKRRDRPIFLRSMEGLSAIEAWGRWSDADVAPAVTLDFDAPLPKKFTLMIRAQGYGPNAGKPSTITIGNQAKPFVAEPGMQTFAVPFETDGEQRRIVIMPAQPVSPQQIGASADKRRLGLGFERLWLTE